MNDYITANTTAVVLLNMLNDLDLDELDKHASKALSQEIENVYRLHLLLNSLQEDL